MNEEFIKNFSKEINKSDVKENKSEEDFIKRKEENDKYFYH